MFVKTAHNTVFGLDSAANIVHLEFTDANLPLFLETKLQAGGSRLSGALSKFEIVPRGNGISLIRDGKFMCAEPDVPRLVCDRDEAAEWETFQLLDNLDRLRRSMRPSIDLFGEHVRRMIAKSEPVKLYVGCGPVPRPGFLNLDVVDMTEDFSVKHPDSFFTFPYADMSWGIPDNSVDYIFNEDFIEHISQLQQIQFLTEAWRVLKPGAIHRVNTPNLIWTMETRSKFSEGFNGVYTGELQWGHIALFSPQSLKEVAKMIGYSDVRLTRKNKGSSPFAVPDFRPGPDRHEVHGNIYADLVK